MTFYMTMANIFLCLAIVKSYIPNIKYKSFRGKIKSISIIWAVILLALIVILGFRDIFTVDSYVYRSAFNYINSSNEIVRTFEVSYDWLNRFVYLLGGNVHNVFFIASLLSIVFLAKGLKDVEYNRYLFIVFYLLTFQYFDLFNIVRQGISMSIFFYASKYIYMRKWKNYMLLTAVAISFHYSALIMLPVYFIGNRRISFAKMIFSVGTFYFLTMFLNQTDILSLIFKGLWRENYSGEFELAFITIAEIIIAFVVLFFKDKLCKNEKDNLYLNLTWLFILFRVGATELFIIHRFSKYFINFYIISLLMFSGILRNRNIKIIIQMGVLFFYQLWFYFYMSNYESFHPYSIVPISKMIEFLGSTFK